MIFTINNGMMTCLVRKEFSCSYWNRGILSTFCSMYYCFHLCCLPQWPHFERATLEWMSYWEFPYVTKLEGCHWLVGPSFMLLVQSMTAVMTPDHLTLHFPSGSGIPAVTLQVMSSVEWQWNFSRTCIPYWGGWYAFDYHNCKLVNKASYSILWKLKYKAISLSFKLRSLCLFKLTKDIHTYTSIQSSHILKVVTLKVHL